MEVAPFEVKLLNEQKLPLIISVPHCGTRFPVELIDDFLPEKLIDLDDTDWLVDELYAFVYSLGIPMIKSNYHRWVIDLNRDPENKPLYNDGRVITALCTTTDFLGNTIYKDGRQSVSIEETNRRKKLYFNPYHQALQKLIEETKSKFGYAIVWDCHSIRSIVPSIRSNRFPDLILGTADEQSASQVFIGTALYQLKQSNWQVNHNEPFKGGYITRHYGQPTNHVHALQLEMCKDLYLMDDEKTWSEERANRIQKLLFQTIKQISQTKP